MPTIKGISIKGAACVCTVAILALPGAVQAPPLPQDLPGQDQVGVPSWQTPDQRDVSRSLYITTSSASRFLAAHSGFQAAVGPEVTIVARTADGEMVKADLLDDAHFVDGVGSKTVIEVSHALYGEATLEVLLPQGREVWVEVIFYGAASWTGPATSDPFGWVVAWPPCRTWPPRAGWRRRTRHVRASATAVPTTGPRVAMTWIAAT